MLTENMSIHKNVSCINEHTVLTFDIYEILLL